MKNYFCKTNKGAQQDVVHTFHQDNTQGLLHAESSYVMEKDESVHTINKTAIIFIAMTLFLYGCNYKEASTSIEKEADVIASCDTLPCVTNSWGNADNVDWIMKQLHKDTIPAFDFSTYHLSKEDELLADSCLRVAWYGEHTWFKMGYIREHYGTWKYVWRIFHIPNGGELGFIEQDVIMKMYLQKHHPDLLIVGNDRAKHFADFQKHIMDSLTLNHEFLGHDIPTFGMNALWYDYLRWYRLRLYKDAWKKIGVSIDKEIWHTEKICEAVEEYKDNTPHFGSGNGQRFTEFYMLYTAALDSMISDMCRMCDSQPQKLSEKPRKVYSTTSEEGIWRRFYSYEDYDEGHWEFDSGMVVGLERTRKLTNEKTRRYKITIKRACRQWLTYRQRTRKKLSPQYRDQYDIATLRFHDFVIAQCRNKFQYGID